jgi:hypothetical protein
LTRLALVVAAAGSASAAAGACGGDPSLAPPLTSGASSGEGGSMFVGSATVTTGPPSPDASGYCGDEVHQIVSNAPNLVFVFDASGSMGTPSGTSTRYGLVQTAAISLVRTLGPLINVGVARFPVFATEADQCHAGELVMPVKAGDGTNADGSDGPTTTEFVAASSTSPSGGTPLAATLRALEAPLSFVPGNTALVLATDGGPNCNDEITCGASTCEANVEGTCPPSAGNCCASGSLSGPSGCIDETGAVDAVADLAAKGFKVFVVGVPGSELYEDVLSQLAIVGNTAQTAAPYYYKVDDLGALEGVFASIASLEITCDFDLTDPPESMGFTNVYLDGQLVPEDADGWTWASSSRVELVGAACARLKSGQVKQVQIVSGCPTVVN